MALPSKGRQGKTIVFQDNLIEGSCADKPTTNLISFVLHGAVTEGEGPEVTEGSVGFLFIFCHLKLGNFTLETDGRV